MPDHPHPLAVVNDFTKTVTAIATAGVAAVVALSNAAPESDYRNAFLGLLGLCAILLLASMLVGIMLIGKLQRFVKDPSKAKPDEENDIYNSCNIPYILLFSASLVLLTAGAVRAMAPQPHATVERVMSVLAAVPFNYNCQSGAERNVQLLRWDDSAKVWVGKLTISCPSEPKTIPVTLNVQMSRSTGEPTQIEAR